MEFRRDAAQNWCIDPYGVHEARWFSQGNPTALVRDGGVEAQDPPPETAFADWWPYLPPAGGDVATPGGRHRHRRVPALSRRRGG